VIREQPVIWAVVAYVLVLMVANEAVFIIYGDWMEQSFDLSLTNLGLASGIIGGAELLGEFTAGWSVDRFGKRRVVILTGVLTSFAYLLLPYVGGTLAVALVMLFLTFLGFELTFVGSIPLLTEVVPSARSVVLSTALAAGSLGRALGALIGPSVWRWLGLPGNGMLAALLTLLGVFVLARWVREAVETDEW
jgi:predicted MFS family arabinose efflux permease